MLMIAALLAQCLPDPELLDGRAIAAAGGTAR